MPFSYWWSIEWSYSWCYSEPLNQMTIRQLLHCCSLLQNSHGSSPTEAELVINSNSNSNKKDTTNQYYTNLSWSYFKHYQRIWVASNEKLPCYRNHNNNDAKTEKHNFITDYIDLNDFWKLTAQLCDLPSSQY